MRSIMLGSGGRRRGVVAAGAAAVLPLAGLGAAQPAAEPARPDKVLQTVDIGTAHDGTLRSIDSTVTTAAGGVEEPQRRSRALSPEEVADDLPLRVLTSYRFGGRSGTDLSELAGVTGRVRIDLTVQNLTAAPRRLAYDSATGIRRAQWAQVAAPLTVVASTRLDAKSVSTVVTPSSGAAGATTNGVLARPRDGGDVVQWAAMLAPPQLSPTATFTLVIDAKSLVVPRFDLTAQPGIVTDVSEAGLLERAFGQDSERQMRLERQTIAVIGQVNKTLGAATRTTIGVRDTLDSSTRTLGRQTVTNLQRSMKGTADSTKQLAGTLAGLDERMGASLERTGSSAISQMRQSVSAMRDMLGSTDQPVPRVEVQPGCAVKVTNTAPSPTVYGQLVRVSQELAAYGAASDGCKAQLTKRLTTMLGPDDPTPQACRTAAASLTCSLLTVQSAAAVVAQDLKDRSAAVAQGLTPTAANDAITRANTLSAQLRTLETTADTLGGTPQAVQDQLAELARTLTEVEKAQTTVRAGITALNRGAKENRARLIGRSGAINQAEALRLQICALERAGRIRPADSAALRGYLSTASCSGGGSTPTPTPTSPPTPTTPPSPSSPAPGPTTTTPAPTTPAVAPVAFAAAGGPGRPPVGYPTPLSDTLAAQAEAWRTVALGTDLEKPAEGSVAAAAKDLATAITAARAALTTAQRSTDLARAVKTTRDQIAALRKPLTELQSKLNEVTAGYATAQQEVKDAVGTAADEFGRNATEAVGPALGDVREAGRAGTEDIARGFDDSRGTLSTAAARVTRDGKVVIDEQKARLEAGSAEAARGVSEEVRAGAKEAAEQAAASTRLVNAANATLQGNLAQILLDIGDPRTNDSGLLGTLTTTATRADRAADRLTTATGQAQGYSTIRREGIDALTARQRQLEASVDRAAQLPPFRTDLPAGARHLTVWAFHVGSVS